MILDENSPTVGPDQTDSEERNTNEDQDAFDAAISGMTEADMSAAIAKLSKSVQTPLRARKPSDSASVDIRRRA